MSGLQKILKEYGTVKVKGNDGTVVVWMWDYENDVPRRKSEMTAKELRANRVLMKQYKKKKEEGC